MIHILEMNFHNIAFSPSVKWNCERVESNIQWYCKYYFEGYEVILNYAYTTWHERNWVKSPTEICQTIHQKKIEKKKINK